MNDRGMIKWAPFNSVVNSKEMTNELIKERQKVNIPELSDDNYHDIEDTIVKAYFTKAAVTITYFENGYLYTITDKIKKIDQIYKLIYLNTKKLLFKQIIKISYF